MIVIVERAKTRRIVAGSSVGIQVEAEFRGLLQCIARNHLIDREECRCVAITEPHDIEQDLSFLRLRNRADLLQVVAVQS